MVVAFTYAFATEVEHIPGFTICPTRLVTDFPCPSCGFGRAFIFISHGMWREAFSLNVLSLVAYAIAPPIAVVLLYEAWSGKDIVEQRLRRHKNRVYIGIAICVALRYLGLLLWG